MTRRTTYTCTLAGAVLAATVCLWAQGDTPIIIEDGSMHMRSTVAWTRFTTQGRDKIHPDAAKAITTVEIVTPNHNASADCQRKQCSISIRYGTTDVVVGTGSDGKGLRVTTDHASFHKGADDNDLAHNDDHSKISSIVVRRGSETLFTATPSGGSKITIHYQQ